MYHHVHIFGAPGSGVSTLGKALADRLGYSFFDTDDYYWFTGDDLPYRRKRNPEHRLRLLRSDLAEAPQFVLSGALFGWGDPVMREQIDLIVYRWLPAALRLERIRKREAARYGRERLLPGGDLHVVFEKFLNWSAGYDQEDTMLQRTRSADLRALEEASVCPVLHLEQDQTVEALVTCIFEFMHT